MDVRCGWLPGDGAAVQYAGGRFGIPFGAYDERVHKLIEGM